MGKNKKFNRDDGVRAEAPGKDYYADLLPKGDALPGFDNVAEAVARHCSVSASLESTGPTTAMKFAAACTSDQTRQVLGDLGVQGPELQGKIQELGLGDRCGISGEMTVAGGKVKHAIRVDCPAPGTH